MSNRGELAISDGTEYFENEPLILNENQGKSQPLLREYYHLTQCEEAVCSFPSD